MTRLAIVLLFLALPCFGQGEGAADLVAKPKPQYRTNVLYLVDTFTAADLCAAQDLRGPWTVVAQNIGTSVTVINSGGQRFFRTKKR